jgi:hypothetical protein
MTEKATVIVLDKDGNPWGPFDGIVAAGEWAHVKWPYAEQDPDEVAGWNVVVLRHPDSA